MGRGMNHTPLKRLSRWGAALGAGLFLFLILAIALFIRFKTSEGGFSAWLSQSFLVRPVKAFALQFTLRILLPFYAMAGLILWLVTLLLGSLFKRGWRHSWSAKESFFLTLSALFWAHLLLWWEVPSTLWVIPGLRHLPFWCIFPFLLLISLAYPCHWAFRTDGVKFRPVLLAGWFSLWSLAPWLPTQLPRLLSPSRGGVDACQVLMIGFDGLREDVGASETQQWEGTAFQNVYTPVPATRTLWNIIWGGDPNYFTIGHSVPSTEEFQGGSISLNTLKLAEEKKWNARFYIDDGGTIGLTHNSRQFDDVLMPASGWESFGPSNLSVHFPLLAAWENWSRAFPSTNPWAPLDSGLKEALRLGRGSRWVMFHSCLAHQPIFLRRSELVFLPNWWTMVPSRMEPLSSAVQVTPSVEQRWDERTNPFRAYKIRCASILDSWRPIWNNLAKDPMYGQATRILFSDHGERFYHVGEKVQLMGVHGFDLDPWVLRTTLRIAGPGFSAPGGSTPADKSVSLLAIRDGIRDLIDSGRPMSIESIINAYPKAPIRYHMLDSSFFQAPLLKYRTINATAIKDGTLVGPDGFWFTNYTKTPEERAKDAAIAWGEGSKLTILKPLEAGGAHKMVFRGYEFVSEELISEEKYLSEKLSVEKILRSQPSPN